MMAELLAISPHTADAPEIERAAEALARGRLVAFPTETVYGLAANAGIGESVERLRAVKGRDAERPFTVHLGSRDAFADYAPNLSPLGRRLARKGWPGPLTLICPVDDPAAAPIYEKLSATGAASVFREGSVGLRCPDHSVALALLHGAGVPTIASSANAAGATPPVDANQIMAELGDRVDIILDAGITRHRKASTIVRINGEGYHIVRPGVWDERTVRRLATLTVLFVCSGNTCRSPMAEGLLSRMLAARLFRRLRLCDGPAAFGYNPHDLGGRCGQGAAARWRPGRCGPGGRADGGV
jgi:protein-tyrosine phosphatase